MEKILFWFLILLPLKNFAQEFAAEGVKTAQIRTENADFGWPLCRLGEVLTLEFDVLDDKYSDLCYSIRHCDSDFEPDDLSFSEFAEGFENRRLENYENSFNTHQSFTHYTLNIPNDDVKLLISGNYIIEIFEEDNEDNVVLRKKFMVCDNFDPSKLSVQVKKPFLTEYSFECQQVEVSVDNSSLSVFNPEKYIKVYTMRNMDFSSRQRLEISGYSGNTVLYQKNSGGNIFQGGSEFEFLDIKDVGFKALGIDAINYERGVYSYVLTPFEPVDVSYTFLEDLNGNYYIKNDKGFSRALEADYVKVLFRLKYDPFADSVFVYGGMTDFQCDTASQMHFNPETELWEKQLVLKQGLYNFQFVEKDGKGGNFFLQGSWTETENVYFTAVYTSLPKNRGERLVMFAVVNSLK